LKILKNLNHIITISPQIVFKIYIDILWVGFQSI